MATQTVKTWDELHDHPLGKQFDDTTLLALLCEYIDLRDELQGMSLADYIDAYFADGDVEDRAAEADRAEVDQDGLVEPCGVGALDVAPGEVGGPAAEEEEKPEVRPVSMTGMRVVYRFPGRNVLTNEEGVTRDTGGTVDFTDVEGEPWSNVSRERVHVIKDGEKYRRVIHVMPREAKEIKGWLAVRLSKAHKEGELLRSLFVEFADFPEKIAFAVMNGKRPYVDRFVQLPGNNFEDDQKPTTRLFGEHCFHVRGNNYIVDVVTP